MSRALDRAEEVVTAYCAQKQRGLRGEDAIAYLTRLIESAINGEVANAMRGAWRKNTVAQVGLREDRELLEWLFSAGSYGVQARQADVLFQLGQRPELGFRAAIRRAMESAAGKVA